MSLAFRRVACDRGGRRLFDDVSFALAAGEAAVVMGTEARGASNAKAKRELGWTLRYPSWRQGFQAVDAELSA